MRTVRWSLYRWTSRVNQQSRTSACSLASEPEPSVLSAQCCDKSVEVLLRQHIDTTGFVPRVVRVVGGEHDDARLGTRCANHGVQVPAGDVRKPQVKHHNIRLQLPDQLDRASRRSGFSDDLGLDVKPQADTEECQFLGNVLNEDNAPCHTTNLQAWCSGEN